MTAVLHDLIALEDEFGAHNYHPLDVIIERAKGVWVWDVDGKKYLDCLAAYSAVNQGHCHPHIQNALVSQAQRVTLTSRAFRNDQFPRLLERLHAISGFDQALLMNSGAERRRREEQQEERRESAGERGDRRRNAVLLAVVERQVVGRYREQTGDG